MGGFNALCILPIFRAVQGSFGRVYLGKWRETPVAVKVLIANGAIKGNPGRCGERQMCYSATRLQQIAAHNPQIVAPIWLKRDAVVALAHSLPYCPACSAGATPSASDLELPESVMNALQEVR